MGGGGGGVRRFGCSGAMRRSILFDAFASGEYVGREVWGKGELGREETLRMSSDMGVDFLELIAYVRLLLAKLGRPALALGVTGTTGLYGLAAEDFDTERAAGLSGTSFSCAVPCDVSDVQ